MNREQTNIEDQIINADSDSCQVDLRVRLLPPSKAVYFYNPNYHNQPVVIIVWQYDEWRPSSLRLKGVSDKCIDITSREMIPQDFEQLHKYRLQVSYYNDWDILIDEERACGFNDDDFINELITFSKVHPLLKQKEIEFSEKEA